MTAGSVVARLAPTFGLTNVSMEGVLRYLTGSPVRQQSVWLFGKSSDESFGKSCNGSLHSPATAYLGRGSSMPASSARSFGTSGSTSGAPRIAADRRLSGARCRGRERHPHPRRRAACTAHLNLCRHRGSRLLCGEGRVRGAIRCPYHGWAYALDGALVASPFVAAEDVPPERAPPASRWRRGVGRLRLRPSLAGHARVGRARSRRSLAQFPRGLRAIRSAELQIARSIRYEVAANWKVHARELQRVLSLRRRPSRVVPRWSPRSSDVAAQSSIGSAAFRIATARGRLRANGTSDARAVRRAERRRKRTPQRRAHLSELHAEPRRRSRGGVRALAARARARRRSSATSSFIPTRCARPDFDPADAVEFWDLVNRQDWRVCEGVQAGMRSQAFRVRLLCADGGREPRHPPLHRVALVRTAGS